MPRDPQGVIGESYKHTDSYASFAINFFIEIAVTFDYLGQAVKVCQASFIFYRRNKLCMQLILLYKHD